MLSSNDRLERAMEFYFEGCFKALLPQHTMYAADSEAMDSKVVLVLGLIMYGT